MFNFLKAQYQKRFFAFILNNIHYYSYRSREEDLREGAFHLVSYLRSTYEKPVIALYGYVFTYKAGKETPAKSMKRVNRSFKAALTRAGIEDFKFHDLRHAFASHFVMRGGNLKELQEILGHRDITMTMRYSHLSQEHKKKAVNLLNGLTASKIGKKSVCHKTVTN